MTTSPRRLSRRELLAGAAVLGAGGVLRRPDAATATAAQEPSPAEVAHLLPTVSHDRLLVKVSLTEPRREAPSLRLGRRAIVGVRTDRAGSFWMFDADGLEPETEYELSLHEAGGGRIDEPWPIRTFPAPDAEPATLRLLFYTCAGGHPGLPVPPGGRAPFLSLATRQRLLRRALSFAPQGLIANGDHVYWDQTTAGRGRGIRSIPGAVELTGMFDPELPVLGTGNEEVLQRAVGPQVAALYGTTLRSLPVFFLQDDHDYFEGDAAADFLVSFPPDPFMLELARASQRLYYPELLPDTHRPAGLPGTGAPDRPPGVSEAFGTLRYGRLLELLLWDCRRYLTLKGEVATFVPPVVERWLLRRMAGSDAGFVVHVPSVPIGWTAGKWGEWYPDVLDDEGRLGVSRPKFFWQNGWLKQHDRIVAAASAMPRLPLFLCGDLHSLAEGILYRSGEHDLSRNPVVSVLTGPLGTRRGWPSAVRGTVGQPARALGMREPLPCLEENGFVIADFEPQSVRLRYFRWKPEDGEAAIDTLEPFRTTELAASVSG